jgi:hypothetical protein
MNVVYNEVHSRDRENTLATSHKILSLKSMGIFNALVKYQVKNQ